VFCLSYGKRNFSKQSTKVKPSQVHLKKKAGEFLAGFAGIQVHIILRMGYHALQALCIIKMPSLSIIVIKRRQKNG
jgi:hypothetical protein